jgi:hypothetical protein
MGESMVTTPLLLRKSSTQIIFPIYITWLGGDETKLQMNGKAFS